MGAHDQPRATERSRAQVEPTADFPIGPDDAGNAVMHGLAIVTAAWRWLTSKLARRA